MSIFVTDDISPCLRLKSFQMEAKEWFDQLCQQLQLEEGSREKAWVVWESVSTNVLETTQVQKLYKCTNYVLFSFKT